ncbi:tetratricopeptide repeat protein [Curtobacterium sp. VKM Ac-2922]|uniref:tetratricopeptide repeat protein n=1 Tax=Curtobacterium sp. VKM Ac-2922 TaxID=2929475 RepID=UPI001FB56D1C|nr:tetratricopeptide repeat protein [Curtobacterium sp. VKM Ac-2922]MCJ1712807.1 tetratricopeptide repeat protein [Curtobacterium sp. VKM Ac-2922]
MSLPPDDRQTPDRDDRAREPRHAAPGTTGVTPGSTFAPISLRPAVDVQVVQDRLRDLGQSRSTEALAERAELLRLLGRLDEALVLAEEVFRLTMFTGERSDKVAARIRRAHVLHDLGRYERAATESALARDTAVTEEWPELEGAAAEIEGWSLFELDRFDEAREVLGRAYEAFRAAGAPAERTDALRSAVETAMRASIARPLVEPERPRADGARTEGAPAAAGTDRPRTAREAAMRRDTEPETRFAEPAKEIPPVRRRVLGAPDAARTEADTLWGKLTDRRRPTDDDR